MTTNEIIEKAKNIYDMLSIDYSSSKEEVYKCYEHFLETLYNSDEDKDMVTSENRKKVEDEFEKFFSMEKEKYDRQVAEMDTQSGYEEAKEMFSMISDETGDMGSDEINTSSSQDESSIEEQNIELFNIVNNRHREARMLENLSREVYTDNVDDISPEFKNSDMSEKLGLLAASTAAFGSGKVRIFKKKDRRVDLSDEVNKEISSGARLSDMNDEMYKKASFVISRAIVNVLSKNKLLNSSFDYSEELMLHFEEDFGRIVDSILRDAKLGSLTIDEFNELSDNEKANIIDRSLYLYNDSRKTNIPHKFESREQARKYKATKQRILAGILAAILFFSAAYGISQIASNNDSSISSSDSSNLPDEGDEIDTSNIAMTIQYKIRYGDYTKERIAEGIGVDADAIQVSEGLSKIKEGDIVNVTLYGEEAVEKGQEYQYKNSPASSENIPLFDCFVEQGEDSMVDVAREMFDEYEILEAYYGGNPNALARDLLAQNPDKVNENGRFLPGRYSVKPKNMTQQMIDMYGYGSTEISK